MCLNDQQVERFWIDGYLALEGVLQQAVIDAAIADLERETDRRAAALAAKGLISDLCSDASFLQRYALLFAQCDQIGQRLEVFELLGPGIFELLWEDTILDHVESLLGTEIMLNPTHHLRAKLPASLLRDLDLPDRDTVPWHQDTFAAPGAEPFGMVTVWVPLVDATPQNGCLEVMPRTFKMGALAHRTTDGGTIEEHARFSVAPQALPCARGGIVLLHEYTLHRSTPNLERTIRWSIDMRFQRAGSPTGRPGLPAFWVRSRQRPWMVRKDYCDWCMQWRAALELDG